MKKSRHLLFSFAHKPYSSFSPVFLWIEIPFFPSVFFLLFFFCGHKGESRSRAAELILLGLNIHLNSIKLSCPVNCVAMKVGKRPFSQAVQADLGLKEKRRNERKGTSKLAPCHQAAV